MKNYTLDEIIKEAYNQEFAKYDDSPKHRFSSRHMCKMKKIFKLYNKNLERQLSVNSRPARRLSLAFVIAAILVMLAAASAAAIGIFTNLSRKEYRDHTQLFAINYENSPETINYIYELAALSDDYVIDDEIQTNLFYAISWHNAKTGAEIIFQQSVKKEFSPNIDNEHGKLETIFIDEKPGLYIDWSSEKRVSGFLAWDNGDYILEIVGNLDENEMLDLAKSAKISENLKNYITNR